MRLIRQSPKSGSSFLILCRGWGYEGRDRKFRGTEHSAVCDIPAYHCAKMGIFVVQQDVSVKHKLLFVLIVPSVWCTHRQLHMQMFANFNQLGLNNRR